MIQRLYWLDWAKAIAIYGVVLGHTIETDSPNWINELNIILTGFHVPLFFLLSGYLFKIKENIFLDFLKNSAKSLLIPYVFFNLISAPILWKLQSYDIWLVGLFEFLECKGHAWAGPTWFLPALFWVRIIAYFLIKINNFKYSLFISFSLAVLPLILSHQIWFGISSALIGTIFFIVGFYLKYFDFITLYLKLKLYYQFTITICLFLGVELLKKTELGIDVALGWVNNPFAYLKTFIYVFMALAFCLFLKNLKCRIIEIISKGCIVIMGIHMIIVQILWVIKGKLSEIFWFTCESPFISVTSFTISIIAAIIMMKYCPMFIGNRR